MVLLVLLIKSPVLNLSLLLQVIFDSLALHGIASRLRAARFQSGALRLNNTKLCFALDTGGNPVSTSPYIQSEANHLVEEFMLLANMQVASIIARAFPKHAMLRWVGSVTLATWIQLHSCVLSRVRARHASLLDALLCNTSWSKHGRLRQPHGSSRQQAWAPSVLKGPAQGQTH